MSPFEKALRITLSHEGFFSNDSDDRGGSTNYGITEAVARQYGFPGKINDLPMEIAKDIYRVLYWDKNRLEDIAEYYQPIAIEMFDIGVNMGIVCAGKFLQRAINCLNRDTSHFPDLKIDGIIGSKTIDYLGQLRKLTEKHSILKMLNALQGAKYIEICERDGTQEKFIRGWLKRV